MDEVIVARAERSTVVLAAIAAFLVLGGAIPFGGWVARGIALAVGFIAVRQVARMRLSVTPEYVVVANYMKTHAVPIDQARIVDEKDRPVFLSDAGGRMDTTGRALYVMDDAGKKVHVALAPVYGNRLDQIAEDLYRAIEDMRSR